MKPFTQRGFILPVTVLLVVIIGISGIGFMNLDFHERVQTLNTVDNHEGLYLASAGIERAREDLKIPNTLSWTTVLNGGVSAYPTDNGTLSPADYALLCPFGASKGCVIPRFQTTAFNPSISANGEEVFSDDNPGTLHDIPFTSFAADGAFAAGHYSVRAYNDAAEPGTNDLNMQLTVRALGHVREEVKVLEATVMAVSTLKLVNCNEAAQPTGDCPDHNQPDDVQNIDGRDPASFPTSSLPSLPPIVDPNNPSACNPANYYCDASHFSGFTYTFSTTDVSLDHTTQDHQVIVTLGNVNIGTQTILTNTIIVANGEVTLNGGGPDLPGQPCGPGISVCVKAPLPFPAIISGGATHGNTGVAIIGTVYAIDGGIDLRGSTLSEGVLISMSIDPIDDIILRGGANVTDGGNLQYYALMPGFTYPESGKGTETVAGGWREIQ